MVREWKTLSDKQRTLESRGMEVYAGMVDNIDYHVGRVVRFLKDIGEYDNTVIIFFSDNGPNPWFSEDYPGNRGSEWLAQFDNSVETVGHPGSNYSYGVGWASSSSGPLDRFKMTVAEGGIRSPLIISGPGVKGGRQVDVFANVTDIMPTMLGMAGLEHPSEFKGRKVERMRGRSFVDVLSGSGKQVYGEDDFVGGEMGNSKWMRKGIYKAVAIAKPYGSGTWQLYNVAEDPGETHDLAKSKPALLTELREAWDQYAKDVGVVLSK
jgi:arylsulfatase